MAMTRDTYDGNAKANSDNKAARFRRFPRLFDMTISDGQQWQQPQKKNIRACLSFFFLVFTESSTSKAHTHKKKAHATNVKNLRVSLWRLKKLGGRRHLVV